MGTEKILIAQPIRGSLIDILPHIQRGGVDDCNVDPLLDNGWRRADYGAANALAITLVF